MEIYNGFSDNLDLLSSNFHWYAFDLDWTLFEIPLDILKKKRFKNQKITR